MGMRIVEWDYGNEDSGMGLWEWNGLWGKIDYMSGLYPRRGVILS